MVGVCNKAVPEMCYMFIRPCQETGTNQLWEIKNMVLNSLLYTPVVKEFLFTVKSCHLLLRLSFTALPMKKTYYLDTIFLCGKLNFQIVYNNTYM